MKKKKKSEKRYIVVEFDGTTTNAWTFRTAQQFVNLVPEHTAFKGLRCASARLHPDDQYDQNEGLRIALERIGFDMDINPFSLIWKAFRSSLVAEGFGDPDYE